MDSFNSVLDSRGTLIIAYPNCESMMLLFTKNIGLLMMCETFVPFLSEYNGKLLNKHRFSINKIYPMYFDSFYVSMLSEKYKGNKGLLGLLRLE